jgi:hypothetical protein
MWPILQYPYVHIPTILHWSIYEFENVFPLYCLVKIFNIIFLLRYYIFLNATNLINPNNLI